MLFLLVDTPVCVNTTLTLLSIEQRGGGVGMRTLLRALLVCAVLSFPRLSLAAPIVNTGPGSNVTAGTGLELFQWLAGEFTVTEGFSITDIYGWMGVVSSGALQVSLYSDGGNVPGASLFSRQATIVSPGNFPTWLGASNLGWLIGPGTYWVAFEMPPGSSFRGYMPSGAAAPLGNEAVTSSGVWVNSDRENFGVMINGTPAVPVPETSSLLLFSTGFFGIFVSRRRLR
jgi:hypothetical protein